MNNFEEQLRASLQRREPGPDFAQRLQRRLQEKKRTGSLRWLAAAALILATSTGFLYMEHERRRQVEGERAREQALEALQISSEKLNLVLRKLNHINENKEKS